MRKILKRESFNKSKTKLLLIILAVVILSITAVGYHLSFNQVTIFDGENEDSIRTRKDTVLEVLEEQGISYITEDEITPALNTPIEDDFEIVIKRAVAITIVSEEETYQILTPVEDVAAAIHQVGLTMGESDEVYPALDEKLKEDMKIEITRAIPINIEVDGQKIELLTTVSSVQEAIDEAQLSLGKLDKISPALNDAVDKGTKIKIIRVKEETITEKEDIDFNTIRKNSTDMYKGNTKVVQQGQKGVMEKQVLVTYEDGVEVNKKVLKEKEVKKPVDQIVKVGTKAVPVVNRGGGGTVVRTLKVTATAYSSQDPGVGNRTSLGLPLGRGVIAVDPSVIPYRTKIYVPGYGFGEALDTGSAIRGNKIDVAFDSRAEALRFGRQSLTIKIYGK